MKTAVITGASSDMGRALETLLREGGWSVLGPSRDELDLAETDKVITYAQGLSKRVDRIDAFVHFAGVWHDHDKALAGQPLDAFSSKQITGTMNVGITSFMLLTAALLPKFSDHTAIVGISDTFTDGGAGWLPYFVSKRAQEDFLVGLAQDYPERLRVFGVSPANTATTPYKKYYPEYAATAQSPEAVADLVAKLINGEIHYHSGAIIELRDGEDRPGYHK